MLENIVWDHKKALKLLKKRKDDIFNRFVTLKQIFDDLASLFEDNVYLNKDLLLHAVESYFIDIERLKEFHGIKHTNDEKIAAFLVKWILRIKPLHIKEGVKVDRYCFMANEYYAMASALVMLELKWREIGKDLQRELLYSLHFRDIDANTFAILLGLIKKLYKKSS